MRFRFPLILALVAAVPCAIASHAGAKSPRRPANLHQAVSISHEADHMVSWVMLSNSYVELDETRLRAVLDQAFPGEFVPQRDDASFVVEGPVAGVQFLVQSRVTGAAGVFMLNTVPGPYTRFSDFTKFIADQTVRKKAQTQRSWLSIDLMSKHSNSTEADAYRFIGRALAKLAPRDATYLVHPTRRVVIAFDEDVRRRLERGEQVP